MSAVSKDYAALAASTSTLLESSMMEGDELYDPTTVPIANEEWSKKGGTSNLCRLCANTSDYFIPIFEGEGLEHELSEKIDKHLPIKVCDSDSLPIHVCYQCASTLIAWHDLLLNCVEAEKKLLQIQQQVEQDDLEESKNIEFDAAPSMDSDNAEDSVEATTPLVTPEEMEKSAPSTSKKNTSIKERPSLKRPLAKKSASSQKKARKTETEISPVGPEDGPAEEETVIGRWGLEAALQDKKPQEGITCIKKSQPTQSDSNINSSEDGFNLDQFAHYKKLYESLMSLDEDVDDENLIVESRSSASGRANWVRRVAAMLEDMESKPIYECEHCGRRLKSRLTLENHVRIHTGERPFTCHICGKSFRANIGLVRHVRDVHDGVKSSPCDICGRMFANKRTKDDHRRTHTDERPYVCAKCGKAFRTSAALYMHNKFHVDIFPFHCTYCDKKFRLRSHLAPHIRTHTGEKPNCCDICGKGFNQKTELKNHRLIHSETRNFDCSSCGKSFKQKRSLKNHEIAFHRRMD